MVNISRSSRQDNLLKKKKSLIDTNATVVHYKDTKSHAPKGNPGKKPPAGFLRAESG